jgi:phosphinothricin acetyltransferase
MNQVIRRASRPDLQRINEIYNTYIEGKHTSFDTDPWTLEERDAWFGKFARSTRYFVLALEVDGEVMGFASSSPFRDKTAYNSSVETTIVLDEVVVGRGLGRPLLAALIELLDEGEVHRAYALIALPNEPSIRLHADLGYRTVGILDEVGYKLDGYHSVQIMERAF